MKKGEKLDGDDDDFLKIFVFNEQQNQGKESIRAENYCIRSPFIAKKNVKKNKTKIVNDQIIFQTFFHLEKFS